MTEPTFLALQGIDELLETRDLVQTHYNSRLALAGVIVNRVERTVEHRAGQAEIASYFGPDLVGSPQLPKRTVLQEGARRGVPLTELVRRERELARFRVVATGAHLLSRTSTLGRAPSNVQGVCAFQRGVRTWPKVPRVKRQRDDLLKS